MRYRVALATRALRRWAHPLLLAGCAISCAPTDAPTIPPLPSDLEGASPARSDDFLVNSYTTHSQYAASVAVAAKDGFVVTWQSHQQDGAGDGIFAQRYTPGGHPRGGEFQVNTYTTNEQEYPSVASDAAGNFVVVWESLGQDGRGYGVFAQRYDAGGAPRGCEFQVNTYTTDNQGGAEVASDVAGDLVVVWMSAGQDGSGFGIFAQRYDSTGTPRGSEFRVNTFTTQGQSFPAVASDPGGNFVVAWASNGQDGSGYGVFAQRYDSAGIPRGSEFQVNTDTIGTQEAPAVASDPEGRFVVAWTGTDLDRTSVGIFARRYEASGAPLGLQFQVNTHATGWQDEPPVAFASGGFVVAWNSAGPDGDLWGVFARCYDSSGAPRGDEFRINAYTTYSQLGSALALSPDGTVVAVWSGSGPGDSSGVFGRRLGCDMPTAAVAAADAVGAGGEP
jgi:hypothetical protein